MNKDAHGGAPGRDFVKMLAERDIQIATGFLRESLGERPPIRSSEMLNRLNQATMCLLRLEKAWPRSQHDELSQPRTIGRFEVIRELGRGGHGVVYLALDSRLQRTVALKVQRAEAVLSPALRQRFVSETEAAAKLQHPNIARIYEVGEAGPRLWYAAEPCDLSLQRWIQKVQPACSQVEAAKFVAIVADAIQYSHERGILHCDVKPSNIMLHADGRASTNGPRKLAEYTPKLIDFGLATSMESVHRRVMNGERTGTPAYMAPEQVTGRYGPIGPATDVYALGIVLYELVTGKPAFTGRDDHAILLRVLNRQFEAPRLVNKRISKSLEAICQKCLAKRPATRYPTATALAADLRRFVEGKRVEATL